MASRGGVYRRTGEEAGRNGSESSVPAAYSAKSKAAATLFLIREGGKSSVLLHGARHVRNHEGGTREAAAAPRGG